MSHVHVFDSSVINVWVAHPHCLYCACGEFRWVEEFGRPPRGRRRLDGLLRRSFATISGKEKEEESL